MKHQYLFWDFDETLGYRDGKWTQTLFDLLQENGQTGIGIDEIRSYMGRGCPWHTPELSHADFFGGVPWWDHMAKYFVQSMRAMGVETTLSERIAGQFRGKYLDLSKWHLYDDTIPCLEKTVEFGYTNILVTNHVPELPELVRGLGISEYFVRLTYSAAVGYEKPNPEIFKAAMCGLDEYAEITMIGDNIKADVKGALDVGLNAILVRKENKENYRYYSILIKPGIFTPLEVGVLDTIVDTTTARGRKNVVNACNAFRKIEQEALVFHPLVICG
jgi:putative hydrolase of the HAD superfamily